MRIKPESWSPDPEKKGPGTRADRASAHAAARIKARHAERDYFGRPIYKDEPKVEGTPAAIKRVRTGTVRLDAWLVANGYAPSRDKAKVVIAEGRVWVDGKNGGKVKPSLAVSDANVIEVKPAEEDASEAEAPEQE